MDLEDVYFQTHISCRFLARYLVLVEDASHMCPYFDCTPCLPTSDILLVVFRMFMLHPWLACLQWVHPNLTGTTIYRKHQETSERTLTAPQKTMGFRDYDPRSAKQGAVPWFLLLDQASKAQSHLPISTSGALGTSLVRPLVAFWWWFFLAISPSVRNKDDERVERWGDAQGTSCGDITPKSVDEDSKKYIS